MPTHECLLCIEADTKGKMQQAQGLSNHFYAFIECLFSSELPLTDHRVSSIVIAPVIILLVPSSFVMPPVLISSITSQAWQEHTSRIPLFVTLIFRLNIHKNAEFAPQDVMHNSMACERRKCDRAALQRAWSGLSVDRGDRCT